MLQLWLEGQLSPAEWEQYKQTAEDAERLEQLEQMAQRMDDWQVPKPKMTTEEAWDAFQGRLSELPKSTPVIPLWRRPAVVGIAASLLLIFCVWFFWEASPVEVYSPVATQVSFELPDQTSIKLNADSRITFSERGFKKDRLVKLQGEAFFQVQKGTPFVVESEYGEIKVACATGKVQVTVPGQEPVLLEAGMATKFTGEDLLVSASFEDERLLDWQKGDFYFKDTQLPLVFEELQRQLGLTIISNTPVEGMIYTGFFNKDNQDAALQSVLEPMGLKYQISGDTVVIE